jgi:hypothetical protein
MAKTLVFLVGALAMCAPFPLHAQSFEDVGIRAQGVAGAFVAVADDATAAWWNSAGLATSQSFADGVIEGGQGGHWGVSLGFPALALSYYHLNISQIQPSGSTGAGSSSRQDLGAAGTGLPDSSASFNQFGATVGHSIGDHVVVGSTLKVMHALSDTRGDVDVGVMATFGRFRAGANVRNLVSGTFGVGSDAVELTRQARAGVAVTSSSRGAIDSVTVSADVDLTTAPVAGREERHIAGGAEAWLRGRRLAVRGGAGANVVSGEGTEAYGSFGVTVSPVHRWFVDGAALWGLNGDRWGIDLRVTF